MHTVRAVTGACLSVTSLERSSRCCVAPDSCRCRSPFVATAAAALLLASAVAASAHCNCCNRSSLTRWSCAHWCVLVVQRSPAAATCITVSDMRCEAHEEAHEDQCPMAAPQQSMGIGDQLQTGQGRCSNAADNAQKPITE